MKKFNIDTIIDNRDKLLIVLESVKNSNLCTKYLNQVISFLDDIAENTKQ